MSTVMLGPDHRIRPLDHLQWVLEVRAVPGGGRWKGQARQLEHAGEARERWLPYAYCRTKAGLETALSRLKVLDPAPLADLPDHFDGSPARPRRPFIEQRIVVPSGAEISRGIALAVAAGISLPQIDAAITANRPRTARMLALVGLQDEQADLGRLRRLSVARNPYEEAAE
jgi:hypothetical protein